jgi:PhnB protein
MTEGDLIRQLDADVEAMLQGSAAPANGETGELLRIASRLRDLPDEEFRKRLKERIMLQQETEVNWIPEGFHAVTPYLHPASAAKLIDFLKATFGAEERGRHPDASGRIMHAEVKIGDSIVEMGEPPQPQPTSLRAYVHDVDEVYRRALAAGAVSLNEPVDQSYGDREAGVRDPSGNVWFISKALNIGDYKHPGLQDVGPYLFPRGAAEFVDFLVKAFDAEVIEVHKSPEGVVAHADLKIGDSRILMGEAHGQWQPMPAGLHYYVPDVDAAYARAVEAGAKAVRPPEDHPYGERGASVTDPQGNHWYIATRTA